MRPSDAKNQRPSRFYLFKIHQKMGEIIIKLGFSTKFYSPSSIRCTEYCQVTRRWSRTRIFSVSSASSFAYRCSTTVKGCSHFPHFRESPPTVKGYSLSITSARGGRRCAHTHFPVSSASSVFWRSVQYGFERATAMCPLSKPVNSFGLQETQRS